MSEACTKINAEIPQQLAERMQEILPWGVKSLLIRSLLEMAMDAIEENGAGVLYLIIDKRYNPLTKKLKENPE